MSKREKPATTAIEALDRSPSHLLHRALQLALDLYADEAGPGAPTQRQYAVLSAVAAREGLTQTDLVRATGIDRSTLADLVARMISKGLLERERSRDDARANTVRLSDEGRTALADARPRVIAADARILGCLAKGRRESFLTALADLARAGEKAMAKADKAAVKAEGAKAGKPPKPPKPPKASKSKKAEAAPGEKVHGDKAKKGAKGKKKAKKAAKTLEAAA